MKIAAPANPRSTPPKISQFASINPPFDIPNTSYYGQMKKA